jgi:DNA-binding phage protein
VAAHEQANGEQRWDGTDMKSLSEGRIFYCCSASLCRQQLRTRDDLCCHMTELIRSATFDRWLSGLRDLRAVARITARLDRLAAYLEAVMEEGGDDPAYIAREVGMSRVGLNKALSGEGNPTLSTVLKVAKALGLKLSIQPAA